ncbi:uncharacterized protein, partial [Drosophila bipectinata]|uniref:uncharacterized protein n=1 Tax=Drosophila bipectinata TaxID=42026 RepID=UPI0038B23918
MNKFTELFMYDTDEDNIMSNKLPTTSKFNDDQENMPLNDSHRSLEPNSNSTRLEHTDLLQEILKNTIEIKNTLKDLTHRVEKLEDDNKKMHSRQLTELTMTKKLITPKKETPILQSPFKTVEAFEKLEEELKKSPELSDRLQNEIIRQEASDPSKFIRIIWRKILNDDVASHYSWKRTPKKKAIDVMAITNAFMGAFNIKF